MTGLDSSAHFPTSESLLDPMNVLKQNQLCVRIHSVLLQPLWHFKGLGVFIFSNFFLSKYFLTRLFPFQGVAVCRKNSLISMQESALFDKLVRREWNASWPVQTAEAGFGCFCKERAKAAESYIRTVKKKRQTQKRKNLFPYTLLILFLLENERNDSNVLWHHDQSDLKNFHRSFHHCTFSIFGLQSSDLVERLLQRGSHLGLKLRDNSVEDKKLAIFTREYFSRDTLSHFRSRRKVPRNNVHKSY